MNISEYPFPRVAVLLAAYNGMQWLEEQVDSILNQQDIEVTVFVSVDKSSDGTEQWLQNLASRHSNVLLLECGQIFGSAGKNFYRLFQEVDFNSFDFVSLADQDDIWYPDKLYRAVVALRQHSCDGYSSNVTAFWENGKRNLINKAQQQREFDYLFESAGPGCTYVFSNHLASKIQQCIIHNVENIDAIIFHDWFCYAYARANGFKWYIDKTPTMLYRQHDSNQFGANSGITSYIRRVGDLFQGWLIGQSIQIVRVTGESGSPFVKQWIDLDRKGFLNLVLNVGKCRRRLRDRCVFFISCLYLAVIGFHKN